jgi:hypothetical protein
MTSAAHDPDRKRKLELAVLTHVLLSPWWLICWAIPAGLLASESAYSSRGDGSYLGGLRPMVWAGLAVYGVGGILWIKLLTDLVRWDREGRNVSWRYPVRWAAWTMLSIYFAIAFLFPGVRRGLAPKHEEQVPGLHPNV